MDIACPTCSATVAQADPNSGAASCPTRGVGGDKMVYVLPYTDAGGKKMPGEFRLTDSTGGVTTFYDVPRATPECP